MELLALTDRNWIALSAACYAIGFIHGSHSLLRHRRHSRLLMFVMMCAGLALQTTGLFMRGLETKGCPLGNTFELLQFTVWSFILVYLFVGPAFRLSLLGFFTGGLAAVLSIVSMIPDAWDSDLRTRIFGDNPWIEFHAALALFSYGIFALLALTSVMYLLQNHYLKRRRQPAMFGYLPSIVQLDTTNFRLLAFGVVVLSTSLLVGGHYFRADPESVNKAKLGVTVFIWASYLSVLVLRWRERLITRRFAWVCIALFIVALASLGPVNRSRAPLSEPKALTTP